MVDEQVDQVDMRSVGDPAYLVHMVGVVVAAPVTSDLFHGDAETASDHASPVTVDRIDQDAERLVFNPAARYTGRGPLAAHASSSTSGE
jgi:hypothetical protein